MILIVDDEIENRAALKAVLESARPAHEVIEASNGVEALKILGENPQIRLLISDLRMPGITGLELLRAARLLRPDVARVLVTAFGTVENTVEAMKLGAIDVLTKPLKLKTVRELAQRLDSKENAALGPKSSSQTLSIPHKQLLDRLKKAAAVPNSTVLFTGESGTGKSHFAELLHQLSSRKDYPFVALNCASIPGELLEAELFGHEKGAFTGAIQSRDGKIFSAEGGTLLLDEIGDMSPPLQAKILQFIQERRYYRVGNNKASLANVRIVAATHQPLHNLVSQGKFREDLYFRLRVVELEVPPLRQRKEDLLWLVPELLQKICEKNQMPPMAVSSGLLQQLWSHDWPGNIRELENTLESSVVLAPEHERLTGVLTTVSTPGARMTDSATQEENIFQEIQPLAALEQQSIEKALARTGGNRKLTAAILGISERSLYRHLEAKSNSREAPQVPAKSQQEPGEPST